MIGGTVIETIILADRVWINCEENQSNDRCAICVKKDAKARTVAPGDSVWWQAGHAYWTPHLEGKKVEDIKLDRIGYSGVPRPTIKEALQ